MRTTLPRLYNESFRPRRLSGSPAWTRDPMSALRDLGGPWVENVCDPGGV